MRREPTRYRAKPLWRWPKRESERRWHTVNSGRVTGKLFLALARRFRPERTFTANQVAHRIARCKLNLARRSVSYCLKLNANKACSR
jgi:hypothetical protein